MSQEQRQGCQHNKDGSDFTGGAEITDEQLEQALKARPDLNKLVLADCKNITDKGLRHVAELAKKLKELDLTNCKIGMTGLDYVKAIGTLQKLHVEGCQNVHAEYLEDFCRARQRCTVFDKTGGKTWALLQAEREASRQYYSNGGSPRAAASSFFARTFFSLQDLALMISHLAFAVYEARPFTARPLAADRRAGPARGAVHPAVAEAGSPTTGVAAAGGLRRGTVAALHFPARRGGVATPRAAGRSRHAKTT
eukprot:g63466.t1